MDIGQFIIFAVFITLALAVGGFIINAVVIGVFMLIGLIGQGVYWVVHKINGVK